MTAEPATARTPSCHDAVTIRCPVCATPFVPAGKRLYCSNACNAAAYRRRKQATPPVDVPRARPRRPITIYECETCDTRALGEQRCTDCGTFMRRIGYGGHCPSCAEPVAVADLLGEEVSR